MAYRIAKFQKFWRVQGFCQAVRAYRAGRRADKKKIWGPLTLKRAATKVSAFQMETSNPTCIRLFLGGGLLPALSLLDTYDF